MFFCRISTFCTLEELLGSIQSLSGIAFLQRDLCAWKDQTNEGESREYWWGRLSRRSPDQSFSLTYWTEWKLLFCQRVCLQADGPGISWHTLVGRLDLFEPQDTHSNVSYFRQGHAPLSCQFVDLLSNYFTVFHLSSLCNGMESNDICLFLGEAKLRTHVWNDGGFVQTRHQPGLLTEMRQWWIALWWLPP